MKTRQLAHLSSPAIAALDKRNGVVILPVGAIEQHGPHLPVLTDTLLCTRVLERVLAALPADVPAWALPALNYGKSNEHTGFPGTISLSAATLTAVLHDIAASVAAAGFRRLAFMNGHGGNVAVLDAAARDIRAATGLMTFCLHPALYCDGSFASNDDERRLGFHAGELETALVQAFEPGLVDMTRAVKHLVKFPETGTPLFFFGQAGTAWLARDWSPTGVFGDATLATPEKGEALLAAVVPKLAALVTVISTFEIPEQA